MFEEEFPRKKTSSGAISVGDDLSRCSEQELLERIEALEQEILRTKESLSQKSKIRDQANAFFGNSHGE